MDYLQLGLYRIPFIEDGERLKTVGNLAEFSIVKESIYYSKSKILPELLLHESLHAAIHMVGLGTPEITNINLTNVCYMLSNLLLSTYVVTGNKNRKLTSYFDEIFKKVINKKTISVEISNRYFTLSLDELDGSIYEINSTLEGMHMKVSTECSRPEIWWLTGLLEHIANEWGIYTKEQKFRFQEEQFVRIMTQAILPYVKRQFTF